MAKVKRFSLILLALCAVVCFAAFASTYVKVAVAEDEVTPKASFVMVDGASVRSGTPTGIRWTATVNQAYYNSLDVGEDDEVSFGAVVTAKKLIDDDELLNKDTAKAQVIYCTATEADFDENGEFTFYASIVYDNMDEWSEAQKKAAYATELVARAFIKVDDAYYYAEGNSDARSMRAVALAAVLNGGDASTLEQYYGDSYTTVETVGYYGINDEVSVFDFPEGASGDNVAVYFNAHPVTAEVVDGKINVSGVENEGDFELKETYNLSVFVDDAAYVQPFVAATKVIRKAEDLSFFELKDVTKVQGTSIKSNTVFDGYYVVANDIDATGYTHQAVKDATLNSTLNGQVNANGEPIIQANGRDNLDNAYYNKGEVDSIENMPIYGGLTGTFDGAGHVISNLTVRDQGLFGLMANGTVKDVAFTDVSLGGSNYQKNVCLFAQNVLAGNFENVYVKANDIYGGDGQQDVGIGQWSDARGNRALIAIQVGGYYDKIGGTNNGWKTTDFKNCVFEYEIKNTTAQYCYSYGLYGMQAGYYGGADDDVGPNFSNVYVISNTTLSVCNQSNQVVYTSTVIMAENEVAEGQEAVDAAADILNGWYGKTADEIKALEGSGAKFGRCKTVSGVKRYATAEAMKGAENDYTSFSGEYWSVSDDGVLSWKTN